MASRHKQVNTALAAKGILHWLADHPKWAGFLACVGLVMTFSPASSTTGVWCSVAGACVFLLLLIQEYTAKTKHPLLYFLLLTPCIVPVLMFGVWRTPLATVVFRESPHISLYRKYRIRWDITLFDYYIEGLGKSVGADIPKPIPVIGMGQSNAGSVSGSPGHPCNFELTPATITNDREIVWIYSGCLSGVMIVDDLRGATPEVIKKVFLSGIYAAYFFCSYFDSDKERCYYSSDVTNHEPFFKAAWDMQKRFGKPFMDKVMMYALLDLQHGGDTTDTETMEDYFGVKLMDSIGVIGPADRQTAIAILKKYGIVIAILDKPRIHLHGVMP